MSSSVKIEPVFKENVKFIWPFASRFLAKALEHSLGEWDLKGIFKTLENGERSLFMVFDGDTPIAAITTRIEEYDTGIKNVIIDFAGGERFSDWSVFTDYIEPIYKSMGCDNMLIAGRLGWSRLHTHKNFKPIYHVIGKKL